MADLIMLSGNALNKGIVDKLDSYYADRLIVFDWNEQCAIKGDKFFCHDIKDVNGIMEYIKREGGLDISFCYTSADLGVLTQRKIHEFKGFDVPDICAIEKTLSKNEMTKRWNQDGLLNRKTIFIEEKCDIKKIEKELMECPKWIVKPDVCSGSRGITIVDIKKDSIEKAYNRAKDVSWNNKVVLEEFIEGTEYTCEMIGDKYGNVSVYGISKKYHTKYNPVNKIAVKLHYNPLDVDDSVQKKIGEFGIKCYKSLGLSSSLGHLELMISNDGRITPLEIGARSSGFIASHLLDSINNTMYLKDYYRVLRGERIENGCRWLTGKSAMFFFYDLPQKTMDEEHCIVEYVPKTIQILAFDRSMIKRGKEYAVIDGDSQRYGYEILVGDRADLTIKSVSNAESKMLNEMFWK